MAKAHHVQPTCKDEKQVMSDIQVIILIDMECSVPMKYISEICAIACILQVDPSHGVWCTAFSEFHQLCSVPRVRTPQAAHVYKHVTGLSFQTLSRYGKTFADTWDELATWLSAYDRSTPIYARDPTMETFFLQSILTQQSRPPIREVCTLLSSPFDKLFLKKSEKREACCIYLPCCFHDPVMSGRAHCAKKDVYDMTNWICSCFKV
jgi:hypothetical protein